MNGVPGSSSSLMAKPCLHEPTLCIIRKLFILAYFYGWRRNRFLFSAFRVVGVHGLWVCRLCWRWHLLLSVFVAHRSSFIVHQVVASAIVDKYIGESARVVREMFGYAKVSRGGYLRNNSGLEEGGKTFTWRHNTSHLCGPKYMAVGRQGLQYHW